MRRWLTVGVWLVGFICSIILFMAFVPPDHLLVKVIAIIAVGFVGGYFFVIICGLAGEPR